MTQVSQRNEKSFYIKILQDAFPRAVVAYNGAISPAPSPLSWPKRPAPRRLSRSPIHAETPILSNDRKVADAGNRPTTRDLMCHQMLQYHYNATQSRETPISRYLGHIERPKKRQTPQIGAIRHQKGVNNC